jgi:hypothetical protein
MAIARRLMQKLKEAINRRVLAGFPILDNQPVKQGVVDPGVYDGITIILVLEESRPDAILSRMHKALKPIPLMGVDYIVVCPSETESGHVRSWTRPLGSSVRFLCLLPSQEMPLDERQDMAVRMALRAGRARYAVILSERITDSALLYLPMMIVDSLRQCMPCSMGREGDQGSHIIVADRLALLAQIVAKSSRVANASLPLPSAPSIIATRKQKIGGMATMPSRAGVLSRCVERIAPQLDELHIYLNGFAEVPEDIRHTNVIVHGMGGPDLKDNGKFYALPREGDASCMTFDDDIAYPDDYVDCMVERLAAYGGRTAIGLHASIFKPQLRSFQHDRQTFCYYHPLACDHQVHLLGTGTAAFSAKTLADMKLDLPTTGMADIWFACAARRAGIRLVSISRPEAYAVPLQDNSADSLYLTMLKDDDLQTRTLRAYSPWLQFQKPNGNDILIQENQFSASLESTYRLDDERR